MTTIAIYRLVTEHWVEPGNVTYALKRVRGQGADNILVHGEDLPAHAELGHLYGLTLVEVDEEHAPHVVAHPEAHAIPSLVPHPTPQLRAHEAPLFPPHLTEPGVPDAGPTRQPQEVPEGPHPDEDEVEVREPAPDGVPVAKKDGRS